MTWIVRWVFLRTMQYARWIPKFSDRIQRLKPVNDFPQNGATQKDFQNWKDAIAAAALFSINKNSPFVIEDNASDVAISATLNQSGRPVAFMSGTLQASERPYPAIEKKAINYWSCGEMIAFITRQQYILVTVRTRSP